MAHIINITTNDIDSLEIMILINLAGLLDAVESGSVTTMFSEKFLFNSFRNAGFEKLGIKQDVLAIMDESGFLDDAKRLGEASFRSSVNSLRSAILDGLLARTTSTSHVYFEIT